MKIIANFKMNKTPFETKEYLMNIVPKSKDFNQEIILCLPYTSIAIGKFMTEGTSIKIGAQNLCEEEEGHSTGEISGRMLKDAGVSYVLVGHSERRSKFKENSKALNKKIKSALKNGLNVILCVGETLAERNTLKTSQVLKDEIEEALKGLYENELENITIAYEPIWAIGSGKTLAVKEIDMAAGIIRKVITNDFSPSAGENISIVYGGSVNSKNVGQISKAKKINGLLIGGACLDESSFLQILSTTNH